MKNIKEFLERSFKKDYTNDYPDDYQLDKINDVTYKEVIEALAKGKNIYDTIGDVDSAIRERLFIYLEENTGLEYDDFYLTWLDKKTKNFEKFENEYLK